MKRLLTFAVVCLASVASATQVSAADLGNTVSGYLEPAPKGTIFTGLYGGLTGGLEWQNIAIEADGFGVDGVGADGFSGGLTTGFDFAAGKWRFGPWLDIGVSNVKTEIMGATAIEQDYYGAAGIRVGFVHGSSFVYGRAGYQLSEWSSDFTDRSIDVQQWIAGVGIESSINNQLAWRVSADYLLLDNVSKIDGEDYTSYLNDTDGLRAQIGIVYRPQ